MDKEIAQRVADTLKAIAHPMRLIIVELLAAGPMCVGEICEKVGEKQSITSQHLSLMKDKGVLASEKQGAKVYYSICNKNVIKVLDCIYTNCKVSDQPQE